MVGKVKYVHEIKLCDYLCEKCIVFFDGKINCGILPRTNYILANYKSMFLTIINNLLWLKVIKIDF